MENYSESVAYYDSIIYDEELLLAFANLLEEKNLENSGDREIEAIKELFGLLDGDGTTEVSSFDKELLKIINEEDIIKAIKRYRKVTRAGLKEAKTYCEILREKGSVPSSAFTLEERVKNYLRRGELIEAVRLYREKTGASLKECKDYCDKLSSEMGIK